MMRGDSESRRNAAARGGGPPRELNIFDHVRVVQKYRRLILVICILAAGTVGVIAYLWPPSYVATASVVPPVKGDEEVGLGMGLLGTGGASLLRQVMDISSTMDMYVGILQSRTVEDAIIDRFDLLRVYDKPTRYRTVRKLRKNVRIEASNQSILYVTVEDADPNRAAAMANAYVEELDKQNKKLSVGQATSERMFLETRLSELEQKLSRIDSIRSREAQVQEMLYELLMRELEIARIEEAKSMPTIQILDPAIPPETRKPKGTVRKAALAGIVAFACVIFFAFVREYHAECGRGEPGPLDGRQDGRRSAGGTMDEEDGGSVVRTTSPG